MARPALFSYEGALRVLGQYEHPWLDKADVFLGVGVLVGGAVEPDVLSLVDPKNEATGALRKILDGITAKLTGLTGVHRQELIAAAHTIIAVTSVFEAFRAEIGSDFDALEITDREKFRILGTEPGGNKEITALSSLAKVSVPGPSATRGFQENLDGSLSDFFAFAVVAVSRFIIGLGGPSRFNDEQFRRVALKTSRDKYTHHYLGLAAAVPEFWIWTLLGEHAATRTAIEQSNTRFTEALTAARTESLELFSRLLSQLSSGPVSPSRSYRTKLADAATAILGKPLLRTSGDTAAVDAVFPTVERGFVAPAYRMALYTETAQPASEKWWEKHTTVRDDIDTFLAAHLAGPDSTALPLLVLGNPGAGKSLLMEVLAARLPADQFTVVTVQLRKVRAEDSVREQIETALADTLSERVAWGQLADECDDSTRVVLLDGFDELVQASGVHQSTYLQQVWDFQEHEADLRRPVAVVITSRMLVADRARIPAGVPIVKLEEFDDQRVDRWLAAWNEANLGTWGFQPLSRAQLKDHGDLARQPLLLLMLVIHAADPTAPDQNLSTAELYGSLIRSFLLRQVRHKGPRQPSDELVAKRAEQSWWQLGIAALAMFNRGHQYVTDEELNKDLAIFATTEERSPAATLDTPVSEADRTVENFFFIHAATLNEGTRSSRRTYEFLHATFGEYLIAEVALNLLEEMVDARTRRVANPFRRSAPPNDDTLYALMSHQVFTKRKPVLEFAAGLFATYDEATRAGILAVLDDLVRSFHDRARSDPHPDYAPVGATLVSRIATYSANLVCLRVLLDDTVPTPVADLFPSAEGDLDAWQSTVHLWQSGLDKEGWQSLVEALTVVPEDSWHIIRRDEVFADLEIQEAQLLGSPVLQGVLRAGVKFVGDDITSEPREQSLLADIVEWIASTPGTAGRNRTLPYDVEMFDDILRLLDHGVRMNGIVRDRMSSALSREAWRLPRDLVERALRHVIPGTAAEWRDTRIEPFESISVICAHPDLAGVFPVDLLPQAFEKILASAFSCVVLVWLTAASNDERVDDAFREFAAQVSEAARPHLGRVGRFYLPIEVFDYLAVPREVEPPLGEELLDVLRVTSHSVEGAVEPRTFLDVIERFAASPAESRPDDAKVEDFVAEYLTDRGVDIPDQAAALEVLRRLAEL